MAARARLQSEKSALRKDRAWIKNPQNPKGFEAKPELAPDGSTNLMRWACSIPGPDGTIWEGGRIPVMLTFSDEYATEPPKAQFRCAR